jgi:ribonuclease HI
VFTDGACIGNPGPGGYGVVLSFMGNRKELSGGARLTTNNRMEMLAAVKALEALKEACEVALYSDSAYLVDAITKGWTRSWKANGWRKKDHGPVLNVDLWQRITALCEYHEVRFTWVKGHNGHVENERCDSLAFAAAKQPDLPADEGYEASLNVAGTLL